MRDMVDSWVRLNKRTETAIDHDDREIGRFLFRFSSKKCIDIEAIFLAAQTPYIWLIQLKILLRLKSLETLLDAIGH
jgi:hypothetical protein